LLAGGLALGFAGLVALWGVQLYGSLQDAYYWTEFPRIRDRSLEAPTPRQTLQNLVAGQFADVPQISLDVKFKHFEQLRAKRDSALADGFLFQAEGDLVPAKIRHGNKTTKVRIRLKGDFTDHLKTDKWSFRVEVRGDDEIFGLRRFSLQSPHTKYYHHEAMYLDHARREGLISVRYFFVDLTLNGDHLGLMAVEEHFSKELLESQGRREGIIVRFDEDDFWESFRRSRHLDQEYYDKGKGARFPRSFNNWKVAWVKPFRAKKVAASPLFTQHSELAIGLLRGLASEKLAPSEVFDVDAIGRFLAVADLWGAWHVLRWHNIRFYLNPVTLKLEPIAFDANTGDGWRREPFAHRQSWLFHFLVTDQAIRRSYTQHVERMLEPQYMSELEEFLVERENAYLSVLHREYPRIPRFDWDTIARKTAYHDVKNSRIFELIPFQQKTIREIEDPPVSSAVYAYLLQEEGETFLEMLNPSYPTVIVDRLTAHEPGLSYPLRELANVPMPVTLARNFNDVMQGVQTPPPRIFRWKLPKTIMERGIRITGTAHFEGQQRHYDFEVRPYSPTLEALPIPRYATLRDVLALHPFLSFDGERFRIEAGTWWVEHPIELPAVLLRRYERGGRRGVEAIHHPGLSVAPGTTLKFAADAFLRVSGPLDLLGEVDQEVVFEAANERWKGVAVLDSPDRSRWQHAVIRDTDFTRRGPWQLPGGVTFYQSDVTIRHSRLENSAAEDALNIIRSKFAIEYSTLSGTRSDALDSDFSLGQLESVSFSEIGGDAVDLSGSSITASSLSFREIRDKAISLGEGSRIEGTSIDIVRAGVGIASKDASRASFRSVRGREIGTALLMVYNKKPEYGRAYLEVRDVSFDDSAALGIAQRGNSLVIDGKQLYAGSLDVEALYASGAMKK